LRGRNDCCNEWPGVSTQIVVEEIFKRNSNNGAHLISRRGRHTVLINDPARVSEATTKSVGVHAECLLILLEELEMPDNLKALDMYRQKFFNVTFARYRRLSASYTNELKVSLFI
jgi:hypothetical protein